MTLPYRWRNTVNFLTDFQLPRDLTLPKKFDTVPRTIQSRCDATILIKWNTFNFSAADFLTGFQRRVEGKSIGSAGHVAQFQGEARIHHPRSDNACSIEPRSPKNLTKRHQDRDINRIHRPWMERGGERRIFRAAISNRFIGTRCRIHIAKWPLVQTDCSKPSLSVLAASPFFFFLFYLLLSLSRPHHGYDVIPAWKPGTFLHSTHDVFFATKERKKRGEDRKSKVACLFHVA